MPINNYLNENRSILIAILTVEQYHETAVMASLLSGTAIGLIYALLAAHKIVQKLKNNIKPVTLSSNVNSSLMGMEIKS